MKSHNLTGPPMTLAWFIWGLGTLLFDLSPGFFWAGLGGLLIGGSVAVAFVGLILDYHWTGQMA